MINRNNTSRLDLKVAEMLNDVTRSTIKKLIIEGHIKVNGENVLPNYKVTSTDNIEINNKAVRNFIHSTQNLNKFKATKQDIEIIYEDENIIVVNKPTGLNSHPVLKHEHNSLLNGLFYHIQHQNEFPKDSRIRLVNRLDKDTSGIVLATKNLTAHDFYTNLFINRSLKKEYYAVVHGDFGEFLNKKDKEFEFVQSYLAKSLQGDKKMVNVPSKKGKLAKTRIYFSKHFNKFGKKKFSLVKVIPETGRTHQIRVHLSNIRFPILGDRLYGGQKYRRLMLHSYALTIPVNGKDQKFVAELPEKFEG